MDSTNMTGNSNDQPKCKILSQVYPLHVEFPSSFAYASYFAACIMSGVIALTTVNLNLLTVFTFWRTPRLRKNVSLFLIMILSVVDAATGATCYPMLTLVLAAELARTNECWIINVQANFMTISWLFSFSVVSAISIERYFGVVHPLTHRVKVTNAKLLLFLGCVWSSCAIVTLLSICHYDALIEIFVPATMAILIFMMTFAYTRIAFVVIRSKKRENLVLQVFEIKQSRDNRLNFLKQLKLVKSSILIVICCFACYMPSLVVIGVMEGSRVSSPLYFASIWCLLLTMSNSIFNSIIYFWRDARLRKETTNMLKNIYLNCIEKIRV